MVLVLDASAVAAFAFKDEDHTYPLEVSRLARADYAVVPAIFWFEIRNILIMGERRKRITVAETADFLRAMIDLNLEVDAVPDEAQVLELARVHGLTVYDASYLEVAQRRRLPLATLDRALVKAAHASGVQLVAAGDR